MLKSIIQINKTLAIDHNLGEIIGFADAVFREGCIRLMVYFQNLHAFKRHFAFPIGVYQSLDGFQFVYRVLILIHHTVYNALSSFISHLIRNLIRVLTRHTKDHAQRQHRQH